MTELPEMTEGECFAARKAESKIKRASNRESSAQMLDELGIGYVSHNGGAHLVVEAKNYKIDFWPGTGKYVGRGGTCKGRGIKNMLKYCNPIEIRQSIMLFALEMERKLRLNDHKGGWENTKDGVLLNKLRVESGELYSALVDPGLGSNSESVIEEAADVANFAMMIADNARGK